MSKKNENEFIVHSEKFEGCSHEKIIKGISGDMFCEICHGTVVQIGDIDE